MKKVLSFVAFALLTCVLAQGQASFTYTTLAAAIGTPASAGQPAGNSVQLTAVTGVNATTINQTAILVDRELMIVALNGVNGKFVTVIRGASGTAAVPHSSGALVVIGPPSYFQSATTTAAESQYVGPCTRSAQVVLPVFAINSGNVYDCQGPATSLGAKWVKGYLASSPTPSAILAPNPGGTAYTSLNTNGTTLGATTLYCTEVFLPVSKLLTGIGVLNGTTVGTGTDKHNVSLYSSLGGAVLANSTAAGVASANASTYQKYAFTSTFFAVGPASYAMCMQTNSTTDTVRMAITGVDDNQWTAGQTGATFGTFPTLTALSAFTTAVGFYGFLY